MTRAVALLLLLSCAPTAPEATPTVRLERSAVTYIAPRVRERVSRARPTPAQPLKGNTCRASWYARGKWTASGERFNPDALTAAHLTLPFGTRLRVESGSKSVTVRITDRGPAAWTGKCLDLSRGAFKKLAPLSRGVIQVKWRVL